MKYLNLCWILTFLIIFSYSINADVCECNDCSSCTDALNNESCTEVRLTADITDYNERCIDNPENFTVKTFDCQGHTIDGTGSKIGIYLITKTDNIIKNCIITDWNTGIYLGTGSDSNQIINNNISNSVDGIRIDFSLNNQLINNVISSNVRYGIYLDGSNNTSVTDNSAINNLEGDFGSVDNSLNNSVINLNIGGTLVSFESKDIILKNSTNPGNLPAGLGHIGKFINVINNSEDSWLALNISYLDSELGEINENTLRIWKNNGSWFECTTFANNCGIDKVNNVVYANITNFGSIFAPLGEIEGSGICECNDCSSCTDALNNESCTEVRLTADITDLSETCINNPENFSNKIFDCQGHMIDGRDYSNTYGIYLHEKQNNTIKNCVITDFRDGIFLNQSSGNNVTNNNFSSNYIGIRLLYSTNNILVNNTANLNEYGIFLASSLDNDVRDNIANSNSWDGIYSYNSTSTINNNIVCGNDYYDFYAFDDWQSSSGDNNVCDKPDGWNDEGTIGCTYSCSSVCFCNSCSSCADALNNESCIEVRLTTDIINYTSSCIDNPRFFENKTFDCRGHMIDGDDSGMYGIYLNGKDNNVIKNCIISDFIYGINLDNSGNNTIENNSISSCTDTGLVVGGNNNEIKFNTIYNN
ncbi:MAG: NosD domain-containing protein, partial [Candidatus Aenigmatarchaeota archaeon]